MCGRLGLGFRVVGFRVQGLGFCFWGLSGAFQELPKCVLVVSVDKGNLVTPTPPPPNLIGILGSSD